MDEKKTSDKKRGPYRSYLKDSSIKVPTSTLLCRRKKRSTDEAGLDDEANAELRSDSSNSKDFETSYLSNLSLQQDEVAESLDKNIKSFPSGQFHRELEIRESSDNIENSDVVNIKSAKNAFDNRDHDKSTITSIEIVNDTVDFNSFDVHFEESDYKQNEALITNSKEESESSFNTDDCDSESESLPNMDNSSDDSSGNLSNDGEDCDSFLNDDPWIDSEEEFHDEDHTNLYDGCDVSRKESELLIMTYALRHNIDEIGLDNLLSLTDCHLPHAEYKSKYHFLKSFNYPKFQEYYYCDDCSIILSFYGETLICNTCSKVYKKKDLRKLEQYFIYIPLKEQLMEFVNGKLYEYFHKIDENDSDIINSKIYKQLIMNDVIKKNDITITWNTDGMSIFESSKQSIWPLQVSINELPYKIRKNNIILCGLWKNEKKPIMNLFLQPFVEEMHDLCTNGFDTTTLFSKEIINIKVYTIICTVDSVARPSIQNMKQYNGSYGCSYCFQKGEQISVNRGTARIYSYSTNTLRSEERHEKLVRLAKRKRKIAKGVKGSSIISEIPYMNIIHSYPPEYMHACLLGVVKTFVTEWFNSKNSNEPWYLGLKLKEINNKLLKIKPPCEITRVPKAIIDTKYKASEWKNFLLYYSLPTLQDFMLKKYYNHWFLLVYSLSILLKQQIKDEDLKLAKKAIIEFVKNIEPLYGKKLMKYNIHLLSHICLYVKNYGALWAWSAFPFETFNGIIKKLFHGTQSVLQQMCKLYSRLRFIKNNSDTFEKDVCSAKARSLFIKLMNQCNVKNCILYEENLKVFGKAKRIQLSLTEKVVIETFTGEVIKNFCDAYNRFAYNKIIFHSTNYRRLQKRNNSCIITKENIIMAISNILKIEYVNSQNIQWIIIGKKYRILHENLCSNGIFRSNLFSFIAEETSSIVCCDIDSIASKCIIVPYKNNKDCIFSLVNTLETD